MKRLIFLVGLALLSIPSSGFSREQESIPLDTDIKYITQTFQNGVTAECTRQIENARGHLQAKAILLAESTLQQCKKEQDNREGQPLFPGNGILREHDRIFALGGNRGSEFQISFKFPIFDLTFYEGADGLFFGYTQQTFATPGWNVRETNYKPELFYDLYSVGGKNFKLDRFRIGADTTSNGQEDEQERTMQGAYVEIAGAYVFSSNTYVKYSNKYKNYTSVVNLSEYQKYIGTSETQYSLSYRGNEITWTKLGESVNIVDFYFKDPWAKLTPYWYIQYYDGGQMSLNRTTKAKSVIRFGIVLNH